MTTSDPEPTPFEDGPSQDRPRAALPDQRASDDELTGDERRTDGVEPDEPAHPDAPTELTKVSWWYVVRRTFRGFGNDECTDLAAALTFYSVLALFPAALALLSLIGLFGLSEETVNTLLQIVRDVGAESTANDIEPTLRTLAEGEGAGIAFVIGLVAALWSASAYVGAFGRGMNRIYGVDEGRPFWKLRPLMLLITVVTVVLTGLVAMALILTGPAARAVGDAIDLGDTAVTVWNIAKWPVMLVVVILIVALLYYATPNVKQPKFRWISIGATVAIVVWIVASAAFGIYVATFATYERTYASVAGGIVLLLWLWITNLALLFGAELDAELERGRELQAGIPAEEAIQLAPRDTRRIDKAAVKEQKDVDRGRRIRVSHGDHD